MHTYVDPRRFLNKVWSLVTFIVIGSLNVILVSGAVAAILLHDKHQQLLMREMQHRSRNLLMLIRSVVCKTLSDESRLAEAQHRGRPAAGCDRPSSNILGRVADGFSAVLWSLLCQICWYTFGSMQHAKGRTI